MKKQLMCEFLNKFHYDGYRHWLRAVSNSCSCIEKLTFQNGFYLNNVPVFGIILAILLSAFI
jgi:hypothetical protein